MVSEKRKEILVNKAKILFEAGKRLAKEDFPLRAFLGSIVSREWTKRKLKTVKNRLLLLIRTF